MTSKYNYTNLFQAKQKVPEKRSRIIEVFEDTNLRAALETST
jgi:hypothetical protein